MKELPLSILRQVRKYEPITTDGVTLFPVLVREYDDWLIARQAIDILQQSLPVAMLSKPLLQVYYEWDVLPAVAGRPGEGTGLWGCAMLALALSLRLGQGLAPEKRMLQFSPVIQKGDPTRLKAVRAVLNGEEIIEITPVQFQRLRPIIAAQNGVALESDEADPELVKAERDLAEMNSVKLNINLEDKITFVAGKCRVSEEDVDLWPIRKLDAYAEVFTREDYFLAYTVAGAFGGFGKGGNPYPHPYYEKQETQSAHMPLKDFANGAGERAVANAGKQVT